MGEQKVYSRENLEEAIKEMLKHESCHSIIFSENYDSILAELYRMQNYKDDGGCSRVEGGFKTEQGGDIYYYNNHMAVKFVDYLPCVNKGYFHLGHKSWDDGMVWNEGNNKDIMPPSPLGDDIAIELKKLFQKYREGKCCSFLASLGRIYRNYNYSSLCSQIMFRLSKVGKSMPHRLLGRVVSMLLTLDVDLNEAYFDYRLYCGNKFLYIASNESKIELLAALSREQNPNASFPIREAQKEAQIEPHFDENNRSELKEPPLNMFERWVLEIGSKL